jgi:hypothetical protein
MKKIAIALLVPLLLTFSFSFALAQVPSGKGSAAISALNVAETHSWDTILTTIIQVPQQKELSFDVALQSQLYTDTLVKSKAGERETSSAEAGIEVRVRLQKLNNNGTPAGDSFLAYPESVTYNKRSQTLMAKFQGIFQQCEVTDPATGECLQYGTDTCLDVTPTDTDGDGVIDDYPVTLDLACLDEEEVQLILDTVSANAFNFVSADLEQGEYLVTVEAQVSQSSSATNGSAEAKALIGLGSMIVDEVRFIKGDAGTGM